MSFNSEQDESPYDMNNYMNTEAVVHALKIEKRTGRMPGVFGRLSDICTVDQKYKSALFACCAHVDSILVDTIDTAQECIEHLKKYDIGRGTFMGLDQQQHLREKMMRKKTFPENVPRMFDLVTVDDPRVLPAFYFALGDTLVAEDMEQATRINSGQKKYRIVTVQGELVDNTDLLDGFYDNGWYYRGETEAIVHAFMIEKRTGRMPGIFGRLSDICTVDQKYKSALFACCTHVDSILVDTIDTAQECIEHLKKYDIGRGTFIGLDQQQHLREKMMRKKTFPENVPRMFDLVTVDDPRVLPAFYFALGDTLVAEDMEQATRINSGQKKYRIVTVQGELVDNTDPLDGFYDNEWYYRGDDDDGAGPSEEPK